MRYGAMAMALLLAGCVSPTVTVDCRIEAGCEWATAGAHEVLPSADAHWVIVDGRGPPAVSHAEVHACYADGRYLIVDVLRAGGMTQASMRDAAWADPPCR